MDPGRVRFHTGFPGKPGPGPFLRPATGTAVPASGTQGGR